MSKGNKTSADKIPVQQEEIVDERAELLSSIRLLNNKISRKQRANLYEPLQDYLTKPIFNQIIRGTFVSLNNIRVANVLKSKMEELAAKNEEILNQ